MYIFIFRHQEIIYAAAAVAVAAGSIIMTLCFVSRVSRSSGKKLASSHTTTNSKSASKNKKKKAKSSNDALNTQPNVAIAVSKEKPKPVATVQVAKTQVTESVKEVHTAPTTSVTSSSSPRKASPPAAVVEKKEVVQTASVAPRETEEDRDERMERQRIIKAAEAKLAEAKAEVARSDKGDNNHSNGSQTKVNTIGFETVSSVGQISSGGDGWALVGKEKKNKKEAVGKPVQGLAAINGGSVAITPAAAVVQTTVVAASSSSVAKEVALEQLQESAPAEPEKVKSVVNIDAQKIGIVIGQKGVTINSIRDATGVEITMPKEKDPSSPTVEAQLFGPADGIVKATKAINDLCIKGYSALLAGPDFKEGSIAVHPMYLPEIIGKGGSCIRSIQEHTGVKISVPSDVPKDDKALRRIFVAGPKDKVSKAKDLIKEITTYFHTAATHPDFVHAEMDIQQKYYNVLIGKNGSERKHIQANFKVSLHIPNADSVTKNVLVVGKQANVDTAQRYIENKLIEVANREAMRLAEASAPKVPTVPQGVPTWTPDDEVHEEWMDEFTHPSSKAKMAAAQAGVQANGYHTQASQEEAPQEIAPDVVTTNAPPAAGSWAAVTSSSETTAAW